MIKYSHFLSEFLEYVILGELFKRIMHTVLEREFHNNSVPDTVFPAGYSMNVRIDHLFHNPFSFTYVSPKIHYQ